MHALTPGRPTREWYPKEGDIWLKQQRRVRTLGDATMTWLRQEGSKGEGETRLKSRLIELGPDHPELPVLDFAEAEEYKVELTFQR
jgi:hypothetical protein